LIANIVLVDEGSFYQILMAAQAMFFAAALTCHLFRHARWRPLIVAVPYAMCLMCWATVVGFVRFATHRQHAAWDPAYPRPVAKVSVKFSNDAITGQVLTTYSTALEQRGHPGDRPQHSSSR